ncbi:DUF397 domain-containing protein [Streptomyces roseoverticillatus]|uniref:DUF397 domain-containing protein n=1 Tax=Streptomyces roseoverticillatus TaxID=66429 RepID=UPI0033C66DC2
MPDIPAEMAIWAKSSYSKAAGNCVEVAGLTSPSTRIGIRDSKNKALPPVQVQPSTWASFLHEVQTGWW